MLRSKCSLKYCGYNPQTSRNTQLLSPLPCLYPGSVFFDVSAENSSQIAIIIHLSIHLLGFTICQTVNCRQPSFSGCCPPDLELFTRARRHGSNTPVLQETLKNVLTATIVLTSTLVVLKVTLVT